MIGLKSVLLLALLALMGPPGQLEAQHARAGVVVASQARAEQPLPSAPAGMGSGIAPAVSLAPVCPSTRRIVVGAGLGFVAGAIFGVLFGVMDHPGLPHLFVDQDMPNFLEWAPAFALLGGAVGAVVGARTARCG